MKNLKQENQTLRVALNMQENKIWQLEMADIISKEQNKEILKNFKEKRSKRLKIINYINRTVIS